MVENIGETKQLILKSCVTPKTWAELLETTGKVSSTLSVHVTNLIDDGFLERTTERLYITTEKGIELSRLVRYVKTTPEGKLSPELINMVHIGLRPTNLSLKENLKLELGGLIGIKHDETLKKIYNNVAKTVQQSVTLWVPKGLEPDKSTHKAIHRLVKLYTKQNPQSLDKKMTIVIEFDIPTALDEVIREEENDEVKTRLIENKEKLLKKLYKNWHRIYSPKT
ncbi:MAG: hypothetical protein KC440_03775 [Nitrosarchaeum sp.]|nr:hypothetical protein [Nitrosarchaeum sp.]